MVGGRGNVPGNLPRDLVAAPLRQAKLKMLKQNARMGKADVSLAHPFFWAPFKLVGVPVAKPGGH